MMCASFVVREQELQLRLAQEERKTMQQEEEERLRSLAAGFEHAQQLRSLLEQAKSMLSASRLFSFNFCP